MSTVTTTTEEKRGWRFPYTLTLEKRIEDIPKWLPAATSIGSVVLAFIISGLILKLIGGQPLRVAQFAYEATFGSWGVFSDTLVKATPLILVGLACAIAFQMKLWNIGAEGQFYIGAFAATMVVMVPLLPAGSMIPTRGISSSAARRAIDSDDDTRSRQDSALDPGAAGIGTTMRTSASSERPCAIASRRRSHFTRYSLCATRPRPWYQ